MSDKRKFYIVCGHYGCGKSNFSVNLALKLAREGRKVYLADLDLVNPYFLSSGYKDMLEKEGIRVIAPLYANTNVDIPAIPPEMNLLFETDADVVMDVGGDDAGSTVLGRFARQLANQNYELIYVVNKYRNLTATPEECLEILREIEEASRCKASCIVNNSHLKQETSAETILSALEFGRECAELAGLPLAATTVPANLKEDAQIKSIDVKWNITPVDIYVKAPWEYPDFNL